MLMGPEKASTRGGAYIQNTDTVLVNRTVNPTTVPEPEKSGLEDREEDDVAEGAPRRGRELMVRVQPGDIIVPNVERAVAAINAFETLKSRLLVDGKDKVEISGRPAITRAGFSKIALAFGLSTEIVKISRIKTGDHYCAHVIARASAPNGRYAEGSASCDSTEFRGSIAGTTHNIESRAATRATNRAIANLVGGGIFSKEELETEDEEQNGMIPPRTIRRAEPKIVAIAGSGGGTGAANTMVGMKNGRITPKQINYILSLSGQQGGQTLSELLAKEYDDRPIDELTAEEASRIIDRLKT
jgi:hypothetical protein